MGILNVSIIFAQLLQSSPNFKYYDIWFIFHTLDFERRSRLNLSNFRISMNDHLSKLVFNHRPECESHLFLPFVSCRFINSWTIIVLKIKNFLLFIHVSLLLLDSCSIFTEKELGQKVKCNEEQSIHYSKEAVDIAIVFIIVKLIIVRQRDVIFDKQDDFLAFLMIK
jgi:hypothetical protein